VGCIHFAPFVAGSYTVSYVRRGVGVEQVVQVHTHVGLVLPNRRTFAKRMSTTLMRLPYT
jgi:hypothetical protein